MLEIKEAEKLIDYFLTVEADRIVEVDPMEITAIGTCKSRMNLYVFSIAENIDSLVLFSIVIADSEKHGIRVFFVENLNADNLLPINEDENTSSLLTYGNMIIDFPKGNLNDFENAIRMVNGIRSGIRREQ